MSGCAPSRMKINVERSALEHYNEWGKKRISGSDSLHSKFVVVFQADPPDGRHQG